MRGRPHRRWLIRSLLDIRLSRFSMAVLAAVSIAATVVIVTNGSGHTAAQMTALAALREPVVPKTETVTVAAAPTPTTTSSAPSAADTGAESGSAASSADSAAGSDASSDADAGDTGGDVTDTGDDGSDDDATSSTTSTTPATTTPTLPTVHHVFEIALSTDSYAAAFSDRSAAPYLHALEAKGTVLRGYETLGHGELADDLAMVSGQAPNPDTSAGCTTYTEFHQGVVANAKGIVSGSGCVYPETALTIGDQVTAKGATWKAYLSGMGQACSHPNSGAVDDAVLPGSGAAYDTRHNPFIYFHSLLDLGDCASDDVDLSHLPSALAHTQATAKLSYIAPDACADAATAASAPPASDSGTGSTTTSTSSTETTTSTASETTTTTTSTTTSTTGTSTENGTATTPAAAPGCAAGQPAGVAAEDAFLKQWVPKILASRAYKDDGVLIVAFAGGQGHAGHPARTGALVLSRYTKKGRVISTAYSPYSLLHSVEDILGDTALAHAQTAPSFAKTVLH